MDKEKLEQRIATLGKRFFNEIQGEAPSIFNKGWWTGKVMDWAMRDEDFKVKMFRFVDVMPCLRSGESLSRHIREYFAGQDGDLPAAMKFGLKSAGLAGKLGGKIMAASIRSNIEKMGRQFIIGQNGNEAVKNIAKLRKDGFAFVIDMLGEAVVSEEEAEQRFKEHLELLDDLGRAKDKWTGHGGSDLDWGSAPLINLSVKPSAFYSQAKPRDFKGSVEGIRKRLAKVYRRVIELGGFMCIDMESLDYKDVTIELFKRLRSADEFRHWPHLGIVFQTYLKQTDKDLEELLAWARQEELPISVRLVKGAYWDHETVRAKQNGWEVPVHTIKAESDAAFERNAARILENSDICHLACGSHNIRSIASVMERARALDVPEEKYEFQVLYGMAGPVRKGLLNVAGRVRLYCPFGQLVPGMAYLVRRLLENTANESFLRQSFADEANVVRLLEDPVETAERVRSKAEPRPEQDRFRNEPEADFTLAGVREAFPRALELVRSRFGRTYPLYIGGNEIETGDLIDSLNPADQSEVVGRVCQAGTGEIDLAVAAAGEAAGSWAGLAGEERAQYLFRAAEIARKRIYELSALQVLEVGKQWDQAHADVCEAIDFLEYYGREMVRLGPPRRMGRAPGELNHYLYRPKGIAAVIAPWNFPLAISLGMASAALVAGNAVLYKPSGLSSVIGFGLVEIFREAGLPDGVFNYVPGRSSVMGDYLIEHPRINLIAFTGSMEVGLRIMEKAARPAPGQDHCKRVVAEMGGKNAIIIDDDAELDGAVRHVVYSAFGYQGQKCSACSRVIVLRDVYDLFVARLAEAVRSLRIGPAEDPANAVGPVVDKAAQSKILDYVGLAEKEGRVLVSHHVSAEEAEKGCYVPLCVAEGITPEHRLAQEEVFGPVLAVMKAENFDQALEWANSTRFALTGAVFSRSPARLERARREFAVGNLYLNRNSTGALVERQPFGGFRMSGVGSKAGGPDYLLQFMDPVVVTENTMRRGFAPVARDDDWV